MLLDIENAAKQSGAQAFWRVDSEEFSKD